jgi:hypothetical protein
MAHLVRFGPPKVRQRTALPVAARLSGGSRFPQWSEPDGVEPGDTEPSREERRQQIVLRLMTGRQKTGGDRAEADRLDAQIKEVREMRFGEPRVVVKLPSSR